jgi:hypothetical protein
LDTGTTFRFLLLLALISVSTLGSLFEMAEQSRAPEVVKERQCRIATQDSGGFERCLEGQDLVLGLVREQALLSLSGVIVVALLIYVLLPTWKCRRSRLVDLGASWDGGQATSAELLPGELDELCTLTGVPRKRVRFMINPYDLSCSAVVFGRFGRHTIALNAGLLRNYAAALNRRDGAASVARRGPDLKACRGVVLHELNHAANHDVGLTYATIALWRAFLLVVMGPVLVWYVAPVFADTSRGFERPLQNLVRVVGVVAAVYLARADILRLREYHADVLEPDWRGDVRSLLAASGGKAESRSWRMRLRDESRRLWHPSDAARLRMLAEDGRLYRTNLVPIGLVGILTGLAASRQSSLEEFGLDTVLLWLSVALALLAVAAPIWRAVMYAADKEAAPPRGWREGAALGVGLVCGTVLSLPADAGVWLPDNYWFLGVLFAGAVVAGVWLAQVAHLATDLVPVRARIAAFWSCTAASIVTIGAPLIVFYFWGPLLLVGPQQAGQGLGASGVFADGTWLPLPRAAALLHQSSLLLSLDAAAVAGSVLLWLVPAILLVLVLLRPRERGRPSVLLRITVPGIAGGAVALASVVVINNRWHEELVRPDAGPATVWLYQAWWIGALIVAAAFAALLAAFVLPRTAVPYAVLSGGLAVLLGLVGCGLLWMFDGCVGPANANFSACPDDEVRRAAPDIVTFLRPALAVPVLGALAVVVAAVGGLAVRDAVSSYQRRLAREVGAAPRRTSDAPDRPGRRRWTASAALVTLTAMLISLTALGTVDSGSERDSAGSPSTQQTSAAQVAGWYYAGGLDIYARMGIDSAYLVLLADYWAKLPKLTEKTTAGQTVAIYRTHFRVLRDAARVCRRLAATVERAERFIPIPDRRAQVKWTAISSDVRGMSQRCSKGLEDGDVSLYDISDESSKLDFDSLDDLFRRIGVAE